MRWVYLEDVERKQGVQIAYVGGEDATGAQMSAMPFAAETLESAAHDYELEVRKDEEHPGHICPTRLSCIPDPDLPQCTEILSFKTPPDRSLSACTSIWITVTWVSVGTTAGRPLVRIRRHCLGLSRVRGHVL